MRKNRGCIRMVALQMIGRRDHAINYAGKVGSPNGEQKEREILSHSIQKKQKNKKKQKKNKTRWIKIFMCEKKTLKLLKQRMRDYDNGIGNNFLNKI